MISTVNRVLFIGAGRMAQAIIKGLVQQSDFHIAVTNNGDEQRLNYVKEKFGVEIVESWREEIETTDVIVLALPPEAHGSLLNELANFIDKHLIVTVAAGIDPAYLEKSLPEGTPVAWMMPNTAAELGKSMTLYTCGTHTNSSHEELLQQMLSGIGSYEKVTEQQIHELTPITGSAPAFVYAMADTLINCAMESGVTEQQARKLVAEMIGGAASMLKTGESPKQLADNVATPGGVTAAGLDVLDRNNFDGLISGAIDACHKRAKI
ncbi:pyrroline-5-carboxylate reductase [Aquibacillus rhizosphaerae]|uniref:Pyrroline-5-carboxylate reductase n=1 Tax=Aquibacillus rhizosphaerae TaxID=3051431 RepID=A0ABT7L5J1_9BACI|nr:pyrroline-5-carboxylate reductase [Aquibacillus sp. LR5S19]MDL4841126.1 pyrroline-5-carboxylate reductase [Aquibacillus sp. LR5S19]